MAIYFCDYNLLQVGRIMLGIGHTNLICPRSVIVVRWFLGSQLALAFSSFTAVGRLGMILTAWFCNLYIGIELKYLYIPVTILAGISLVGFFCSIYASYLDEQ